MTTFHDDIVAVLKDNFSECADRYAEYVATEIEKKVVEHVMRQCRKRLEEEGVINFSL